VNTGDRIGHPSCEGGVATGSHIHITRQYNGEWILAYGSLAFDMDGWKAIKGDAEYKGMLVRDLQVVNANTNANSKSIITKENLFACKNQIASIN
jgi:hypothetical protein